MGNGYSGLLELIQRDTDCQYLSDLKGKIRCVEIRSILKKIRVKDYSFLEWRDTFLYLSGGTIIVNSLREVKKELKKL